MKKYKKWFKGAIIIIFILIFIYLIINIDIYSRQSLIDYFLLLRESKNFLVFFTFIITVLVIFFVPISWFTALSAFFFGMKGFLYVFAAGIIGCIISFYIGRVFREDVMKIIYKVYHRKKRKFNLDEITKKLNLSGFGYVFFLRSMPFIPYSIINYVSGISSINFKDYILGTILGMGPSLIISTYFFAKAISITKDPLGAFMAAIVKVTYVVVVLLWQRKSKYRTKE